MAADKRFVYVLKGADTIPRFYIGLTSDVRGGSTTITRGGVCIRRGTVPGNCTS
jgi:hypothetical protein